MIRLDQHDFAVKPVLFEAVSSNQNEVKAQHGTFLYSIHWQNITQRASSALSR